jgi:hypothetical protein
MPQSAVVAAEGFFFMGAAHTRSRGVPLNNLSDCPSPFDARFMPQPAAVAAGGFFFMGAAQTRSRGVPLNNLSDCPSPFDARFMPQPAAVAAGGYSRIYLLAKTSLMATSVTMSRRP